MHRLKFYSALLFLTASMFFLCEVISGRAEPWFDSHMGFGLSLTHQDGIRVIEFVWSTGYRQFQDGTVLTYKCAPHFESIYAKKYRNTRAGGIRINQ
jgi:hypothetical protein